MVVSSAKLIATVLAGLAAVTSGLQHTGRLTMPATVPVTRHWQLTDGMPRAMSGPQAGEPKDIAAAFVQEMRPEFEFQVTDAYRTSHNGVTHMYIRQTLDKIPIFNGVGNLNIGSDGSILSYYDSFYDGEVPSSTPTLSPEMALFNFAEFIVREIPTQSTVAAAQHALRTSFLGAGIRSARTEMRADKQVHVLSAPGFGIREEAEATLVYLEVDGGRSLRLGWDMVVEFEDNAFDVIVDAETGDVLALYDWVQDASYEAFPVGVNDPDDGDREIVGGDDDWHSHGDKADYTVTIGNNAYAQENWSGSSAWENNYRPDGSSSLNFEYPVDYAQEPREYADASITNLFVWTNFIHDIFYNYGFDEVSGNFQEDNFGKGGFGNDAVQSNAQDGAGYNNANFMTPPDGSRPRMRMYLWSGFTPMKDGDFENGIVIHEYAHGISNRLTGGPSNANCLSGTQSGGMGEGWGDNFANFLRMREDYTRDIVFPMGDYVAPGGIRYYPYATDFDVNPLTYGYLLQSQYQAVHAAGTIWATILYGAYWDMVDAHGFDADWYNGSGGNNMLMQDVVDGMKFQPCMPGFMDARDAILLADEANYDGQNVCLLWNAFARRGLGVSAKNNPVVEAFDVPAECM